MQRPTPLVLSLALVCLGLIQGASTEGTSTGENSTLQTVFSAVRDDAVANHGENVSLSHFSVSLLGVGFSADGGVMSNFSTLRLLGAEVSSDLNVTTVQLFARVDSLQVSGLRFSLDALNRTVSGNLSLAVHGNVLSVRVNISVDANNTCGAVLDSLFFKAFSGVSVSQLDVDDVLERLLVKKFLGRVIGGLLLPLRIDAQLRLQEFLADSIPRICDFQY